MTWFVLAVGLVLVILFLRKQPSTTGSTWPVHARRPLTPPEQSLYWRLRDAVPDHVVLAQVQLSRFLGLNKGTKRSQWFPRISQKSIDFLVCDKSFAIIAAIELDDSSHDSSSAKRRDEQKATALRSAGIRLIRYRTNDLPDSAKIASDVGTARPQVPVATIDAAAPTRIEPTL